MIQMTSSLLVLQERGVISGEARSALREAQSRLLVLAGVYESLLLPNADARRVDVAGLVRTLASALGANSGPDIDVKITTDCDEMLLGVSQAVPVGLIVNEAITNSLKHAFNDSGAGEVLITLRIAGTKCSLVVSDDGSGFDDPTRQSSLGMRLMRSLARQLRARFSIDGSSGTTVCLDWTSVDEDASETGISMGTLQPA